MKAAVLLLAAGLGWAAARAPAATAEPFVPIKPDYKKPQEVPETFFNPFRAVAGGDAAGSKKDPALASNEAVAGAIGRRGISGVVLGADLGANRVLIGDQVFAVGDELEFPDEAKAGLAPLIAGSSVILREVRSDHLGFEISTDGESARRLTFSLRPFWRP